MGINSPACYLAMAQTAPMKLFRFRGPANVPLSILVTLAPTGGDNVDLYAMQGLRL